MERLSDRKNVALIPVQRDADQLFPSGFRISGDKGGNRRGVKDVIPKLAAGPRSLLREVGVLLILDADGRAKLTSDLTKLCQAAAFKVVLASQHSDITGLADLVLPIAGPYDREGTVTNDQGLLQWLRPARQLQGLARPDWLAVAELGRLLTGEGGLYTHSGDVTWKINQTIPSYSQATRFRLGLKGQFVGSAA